MRNLLIFLSLTTITAFLAACGGAGSSGSSGADGATGSDGSVSTPSQTGTLALTQYTPSKGGNVYVSTRCTEVNPREHMGTASDATCTGIDNFSNYTGTGAKTDNDTGLGSISAVYTLSGTDNVTSGYNTKRYYVYEGTSSSGRELNANMAATASDTAIGVVPGNHQSSYVKSEDGDNITISTSMVCGNDRDLVGDCSSIDTRLKPFGHGNYTITLSGYDLGTLGANNAADGPVVFDNGSISHLTVCPGNEGGDTTASCATVALSDRGTIPAVTGVGDDNDSLMVHLVADTTSTNDFVAIQRDNDYMIAADVAVSTSKDTAPTLTADTTGFDIDNNTTTWAGRVTGFSKYYVAGITNDNTSAVTYAPISSGAIGTSIDATSLSHQESSAAVAIADMLLADGGTITYLMSASEDNVSIFKVGSSTLTMWNDNASGLNLLGDNQTMGYMSNQMAFAASPNSDGTAANDRAIIVGFYDNTSSEPALRAFTSTAVDTVTAIDNGSFRIIGHGWDAVDKTMSDNATAFWGDNQSTAGAAQPPLNEAEGVNPDAAAAWCDDGNTGGALWLAITADNLSGFTLSKWTDNGTVAPDWWDLFNISDISGTTSDNSSEDNITSMSLACDPDDYMPVLAVGYDSTNGDIALAKFDNSTFTLDTNGANYGSNYPSSSGSWEKLWECAACAEQMQPVTVSVSSDGSAYAVGYTEPPVTGRTNDNASFVIFYDE